MLVVVLLAVLSIGGGSYTSSAAASSEPFQTVSSAADDALVTAAADTTNRQRSVSRPRARRPLALAALTARNLRGLASQWRPRRDVALLIPMLRGPPVLRM
jgi:hypothetical protein